MELEGDHGFEVTITNPGAFAALGTLFLTEVTIDDDERELLLLLNNTMSPERFEKSQLMEFRIILM